MRFKWCLIGVLMGWAMLTVTECAGQKLWLLPDLATPDTGTAVVVTENVGGVHSTYKLSMTALTAYIGTVSGGSNVSNSNLNWTGNYTANGMGHSEVWTGFSAMNWTVGGGGWVLHSSSVAFHWVIADSAGSLAMNFHDGGTTGTDSLFLRKLLIRAITRLSFNDSAGNEQLRVDTNNTSVRHLTGLTQPTVNVGVGAGTSFTIRISGTDVAGRVDVTTGTGCVSGIIVTVVFGSAYSIAPRCVMITPANQAAAHLVVDPSAVYVDVSSITRLKFEISNMLGEVLADSTQYSWYYLVVE